MKKMLSIILVSYCLLAVPVSADWAPGDGHKMHFPQLPDEEGWNVHAIAPYPLADDWECSETGPVSDIHLWGSWLSGNTGTIIEFWVAIYSNLPADDPENPHDYSIPGEELWSMWVDWNDVVAQHITPDPPLAEGYYMPGAYDVYPDHYDYWQYNIADIPSPFTQTQGEIYWLVVSAWVDMPEFFAWGWKSSVDHWNDNAVFKNAITLEWDELYEPPDYTNQLDLAFVITTEQQEIPTLSEWGMLILALLLLAIGTVAVVRGKKAVLSRIG